MDESNPRRSRGLAAAAIRRARGKKLEERLESAALIGSLHAATPEEKELYEAIDEVAIPAIQSQKQTKNAKPTLPSVLEPIFGRINPRADLWKGFYTEFSKLANEEDRIVKATAKNEYLAASCTYKRGAVVWHERGKPEQGLYSLLEMPKCGIWRIGDGVSENFQERFRALAARAGLTLGWTADERCLERSVVWVSDTFRFDPWRRISQLVCASDVATETLLTCSALDGV